MLGHKAPLFFTGCTNKSNQTTAQTKRAKNEIMYTRLAPALRPARLALLGMPPRGRGGEKKLLKGTECPNNTHTRGVPTAPVQGRSGVGKHGTFWAQLGSEHLSHLRKVPTGPQGTGKGVLLDTSAKVLWTPGGPARGRAPEPGLSRSQHVEGWEEGLGQAMRWALCIVWAARAPQARAGKDCSRRDASQSAC